MKVNQKVYLVQTDTTVGLLSQNKEKLNKIKKRPINQKILREVDSLTTLKTFTRVPNKFKNLVRRKSKTTFIIKKESFRVVKNKKHLEFLKKFKWMYSTSANITNKKFDENWARSVADIIVGKDFQEKKPSTILKISNYSIKRIR